MAPPQDPTIFNILTGKFLSSGLALNKNFNNLEGDDLIFARAAQAAVFPAAVHLVPATVQFLNRVQP